jgi:acyl-CoA synthetase (AMP-forming)/AMP-acid ligase II
VTLLSIFANNSIAVPLCTTFPNHELRYIVNHSEPLLLLSSEKFRDKAEDVIREGMQKKPIVAVDKISAGNRSAESIHLADNGTDDGGMMLYTSGTTSRPVSAVPA